MNKKTNKKRIGFFLIGLYEGGGENVILDLAKGFAEDGFDVDLLLFSRKGVLEKRIDLQINIIDLNVSRILFSILPIIKYLRKEKPVFVLGTSEHANLILILAKIFSRTKTKVFVRVGMTFSDLFKNYKNKRDKLIPFLIKVLYPKADVIIANSKNVADDLIKTSKISKDKIKVIYNPKFIEEIKEKSKKGEWLYPKKFTILAIGRLEKQKDFKTLIRTFALVKQKTDAQLIILGEGGQQKELEKLVLDLNIKDVYLEGFTDNPYFYMANSDVLVSTSLWEGFSNVLIEAGILGLPIIATDCGSGSRELLAPNSDFNKQLKKGKIEYAEYGVLAAKQDVENIAGVILKLYQNKELLKKYGQKSQRRSQIFEIKEIIKEYKIYEFSNY
ncbi:MAG: glycosyltransferase [Candidatus Pacebacteria bacterium]|nr:glycosyltransferase [Candidatus Paceibacterota bacterium]